jgi:hypothetical protein
MAPAGVIRPLCNKGLNSLAGILKYRYGRFVYVFSEALVSECWSAGMAPAGVIRPLCNKGLN